MSGNGGNHSLKYAALVSHKFLKCRPLTIRKNEKMINLLKKVKDIEEDLLKIIDEVGAEVQVSIDENALLEKAVSRIQLFTALGGVHAQLKQVQELR